MTHHPIHILHLTGHWLRWAIIQPGPAPQITASGTIEETPEAALEQFFARKPDRRARIALYDSRPIYYNFAFTLPAEALKQKDRILRLKIAQEVGVNEEAVYWAARIEPRRDVPGQSDVFITIARRDALQAVVDWRDRHNLSNLWVGADLTAIRTLLGAAAEPAVIVNAEPRGGVTFYHANASRQILKESADERIMPRADLSWSGAAGRIQFGGEVPAKIFELYPALGELNLIPNDQLKSSSSAALLSLLPARALEFDPVLLGGILEHGSGHSPADDLLRITRPPVLETLLAKFTVERLAALAILVAGAVGYTAFATHKASVAARDAVLARAQMSEPVMRQLLQHETLLRRIKTDRKLLMPVFEAIHRAAPEGVTLKSLSIGESGALAIVGACKSPQAPDDFARQLGLSAVLDRIELKDVKPDPKAKIVSFQIMGHVKGRGR